MNRIVEVLNWYVELKKQRGRSVPLIRGAPNGQSDPWRSSEILHAVEPLVLITRSRTVVRLVGPALKPTDFFGSGFPVEWRSHVRRKTRAMVEVHAAQPAPKLSALEMHASPPARKTRSSQAALEMHATQPAPKSSAPKTHAPQPAPKSSAQKTHALQPAPKSSAQKTHALQPAPKMHAPPPAPVELVKFAKRDGPLRQKQVRKFLEMANSGREPTDLFSNIKREVLETVTLRTGLTPPTKVKRLLAPPSPLVLQGEENEDVDNPAWLANDLISGNRSSNSKFATFINGHRARASRARLVAQETVKFDDDLDDLLHQVQEVDRKKLIIRRRENTALDSEDDSWDENDLVSY